MTPSEERFGIYAWGVVAYNVLVILWGAFVRATGSGAGCGDHWPDCNGEVIPWDAGTETLIEFAHRATSGLALLSAVVLVVWAFRVWPVGHRVRRAAAFSMLFMLMEAAVGAVLVLLALVAQNDSVARACVMGVHLVNTFLLMGALTLTAWWGRGAPGRVAPLPGVLRLFFVVGVGMTLVLGASGAVTALGDTLFPASSLAEGIAQDFSPTAHFLIRLRVLHPLLAVTTAGWLVVTAALAAGKRPSPAVRRAAMLLVGALAVQIFAGVVNLLLLAPTWLQLVHLLLADLVWIALVLLIAAALGAPRMQAAGAAPAGPEPSLS
ncbi:MAG: COX15/CtaA family protein [Myxococcota bacterium]|nr:COX15/CtaA family protein [Myxococcota bacterium]